MVLLEVEKYRKSKAGIKNQAKNKVKQITKEQLEEWPEKGRKKDKENFYKKLQVLPLSRMTMPQRI